MSRRTGFTLVEILIVVIILGILAAIVIPQFTEASNDARTSALASDLQTLRSQIELYKVQHLEMLPGQSSAAGVLPVVVVAADFIADLTGKTDIYGAASATGAYGPYLQKFPTNPFNNLDTVEVGAAAPAAGNCGWYFKTDTGQIYADDTAHIGL